ncbi:MAG: PilZ domain-containing protein [Bacteroidales bacterium]
MPSCTVLIAARDLLEPLRQELRVNGDVLLFTDAEPLRALETIADRRPALIAVEQHFAASPRGAALINRIKADASLVASRILVVAPGAGVSRTVHRPEATVPKGPVDQQGTRRVPRITMRDGTEILVDGNAAGLVNLSTLGAQVMCGVALKPNSRVRMTMADGDQALRVAGAVVWARFEIPDPNSGPSYRAGIEFLGPDPDALEALCERWKA